VRLLLFTGKGGVGTTTISAATGVHAARCGRKTLLITMADDASPADVLGVQPTARPTEIEPGLAVLRPDPRQRLATLWPQLGGQFAAALRGLAADQQAVESLTDLPGAPELLTLLELRDQVAADRWDLVLVDCPAADRATRWLALPDTVQRCLDLALPVEQRVHRAIALGALAATGSSTGVDPLSTGLDRLAAGLAEVRDLLAGPDCSVLLVSTGATTAVRQARRAWTALSLHGLRVAAVIANQQQAEDAARLEPAFPGLPVRAVPRSATEPLGLAALADLAEAWHGRPDGDAAWLDRLVRPERQSTSGPDPRVERRGDDIRDGFELRLPLPLAERGALELSRQGDDLIVELAGHRRVIRLASALRRCQVSGARLMDGELVVAFLPDPALWPAL
jgi:arsenite/tail-anchored protein-transporting ATPase